MAKAKEIKGLVVEVDGSISGLKKAINEATGVMKKAENSFSKINKAMQLDPSNTELYAQKQKVLNNAIIETTNTLKKLEAQKKQVDNSSSGIDKTTEDYNELILSISKCKAKLKEYEDQQTSLTANVQIFLNNLEKASGKLDTIASSTAGLSRAFQVVASYSFKAFQEYETGIANIQKIITNVSNETINQLKELAIETGTTFTDISEIASIAATLGIAEKDIASFTKAMSDLSAATNGSIGGEDGAKMVARFLNVLGLGQDEAENFGSAITYVGDQFAATADEILTLSSRMASIATITDVSKDDLIGLAAEMKNLGINTSTGASAINKAFLKIQNAIETSDDTLETWAKTSGRTISQFKKDWSTDSMGVFLDFLDGLEVSGKMTSALNAELANLGDEEDTVSERFAQIAKEGDSAAVILNDLELNTVRTAETMLKLAGNGETVRQAIADSNEAWEDNTKLAEKANTIYDTTERQLQGMWESIKQLASSIGEVIMPTAKELIDFVTDVAKDLAGMSDTSKKLVTSFVLIGASISPVTRGLSNMIKPIVNLTRFVGSLTKKTETITELTSKIVPDADGMCHIITETNTKLVKTTASASALGVALKTLGAISAGVAVAGMLKLVYDNSDLTNVSRLTEELRELGITAKETFSSNLVQYGVDISQLGINNDTFTNINNLTESLRNTKKGTEEYTAKEKELNEELAKFNELSPDVQYHFDEETGKIVDQEGELANLRTAWTDYQNEKLKQVWLDSHNEEYLKALELEESYKQRMLETQVALQSATGTRKNELENQYNLLKKYYASNETMIENYGKVYEATGDEVKATIREVNGEKFVIDTSSVENASQTLQEAHDKMMAIYQLYNEGYATQEEAQQATEDWANALEEYNKLKDATDLVANDTVLALDQEVQDKMITGSDLTLAGVESNISTAESDIQTAANKTDEYIKSILASPHSMTVDVYYVEHNKPSGTSGAYIGGGFSSGGYGDRLNKAISSISKTLNSTSKLRDMASGGYSGKFTIKNNFTITNGNSISENTVKSWADVMANEINERLGELL